MSLPALIGERGISEEVFSALKNSIYPGAADESVLMAWDYCAARGLDVMLKPVHLVPMSVKVAGRNGQKDRYEWRDVVMPGIGLYRIQADRSGTYAGMSAPTFGDVIEEDLSGVLTRYPEWCEITVDKLMGDRTVKFTARVYWMESYATAGNDTAAPNKMWKKRPRGQLEKCAEALALRKAWPEIGQQPTAEEMEGKELNEKDVTPRTYPSQRLAETINQSEINDEHKQAILDLAHIAKMKGVKAFQEAYKALSDDYKVAIGIPKRNELNALAKKCDEDRESSNAGAIKVAEEALDGMVDDFMVDFGDEPANEELPE